MITGHGCRCSLYEPRREWHVGRVYELRELRRASGLGQRDFAQQLSVPLETFRTWDSGRRGVPAQIMERARLLVAHVCGHSKLRPLAQPADQRQVNVAPELLSLDHLAREIGVHPRTLRAAARAGRLQVEFSARSAFGHPIRIATRAAAHAFKEQHYRRYGGQSRAVAPLAVAPSDYDSRLRILRNDLGLSQGALAALIGAAGKAVVYQWESRKRTPSPVLWQRVIALLEREDRSDEQVQGLASSPSQAFLVGLSDRRSLRATARCVLLRPEVPDSPRIGRENVTCRRCRSHGEASKAICVPGYAT